MFLGMFMFLSIMTLYKNTNTSYGTDRAGMKVPPKRRMSTTFFWKTPVNDLINSELSCHNQKADVLE